MTNREKYIDNASNENLVATIMSKISTMPRFSSIDGFTDAGEELIEWLSQEAELSADEMFEELGYKCVSNEFTNGQHFIRYDFPMINNGVRIIKIADEEYECYYKKNGEVFDCYITKTEDKAIHKKIKELKG